MNIKKTAVITAIAGVVLGASFAAAQVTTTSSCYQFERNLRVGNTGADVKALQQTLNANGFTVAAAGHAGSAGMETSYFGNATKNALIKWQEANAATTLAPWGLTSGTGFFGATSRAEMNKCAGTPSTPTTPGTGTVSGAVAVSLASVQPNNVLVAGSAHAKLADVVFSGTGIVTNVKLQRIGVSNNNVLENVYLYDGNTRIADGVSVMNDGSINFNNGMGIFSVTGSKVISVYADISAASAGGQSVGVALTGYTVSGASQATVSGLNGPVLPVGTADIARVGVSSPTSQTSANVGDTDVNVLSFNLDVAKHDVYFTGASFRMIGSAQPSSLTNVKLYIDGVQYGNAVAVNANGKINFSGNTVLTVGPHNVRIAGDIADGAGRKFYVVLEEGGDMLFQDSQLAGVYAIAKGSTADNALAIRNLKNADLTIDSCVEGNCVLLKKDSNFSSQQVTNGGTNQTIGKFVISALSEPVKLMSTYVDVVGKDNTSNVVASSTTNLTILVNGMIVDSGKTESLKSGSSDRTYVSNLNNIIINPGQSATIEVRADMKGTDGKPLTNDIKTLQVSLESFTFQGTQSYEIKDATTISNEVTLGSGSAKFSKNSSRTDITATPDQSDVKIGSFILSAGNVEAITVSEIMVNVKGSGTPHSFDVNSSLSSLTLKNAAGAVLGYGKVDTSGNRVFNFNETIAVNGSQTYDLYADFIDATSSSYIVVTASSTFRGNVSGNQSNKVSEANNFATTTIGTASLVYKGLSSNSAAGQAVTGGSVLTTDFMFASDNPVSVNKVQLKVDGNVAAVSSVKIAGVLATGSNGQYSANINVAIGSGFGTAIPVEVTYNQPTTQNGLSSATSAVQLTYVGTNASGVKLGADNNWSSAISSTSTAKEAKSAIALVKSVTVSSVTGKVAGANVKVGSITVNTVGSLKVTKIPVALSLSDSATSSTLTFKRNNTTVSSTESSNVYTLDDAVVSGTVTYDVYATIGGSGSGTPTLTLGNAASFEWDDSVNKFTGDLIPNYNN